MAVCNTRRPFGVPLRIDFWGSILEFHVYGSCHVSLSSKMHFCLGPKYTLIAAYIPSANNQAMNPPPPPRPLAIHLSIIYTLYTILYTLYIISKKTVYDRLVLQTRGTWHVLLRAACCPGATGLSKAEHCCLPTLKPTQNPRV